MNMASEDRQEIDDNVQDAELVDAGAGRTRHALIWLMLAAMLLLLLAASGWFYQLHRQHDALQQQVLAEQATLSEAVARVRQQDSDRHDALQQEMQQLQQRLAALEARDEDDRAELLRSWTLREIQYLLDMANQRALLAQDVGGALTALRLADRRLESLSDYRLHPLRALIAEEIMALEAVSRVDVPGIALQLQTASARVDGLRVVKGPEVARIKAADEADRDDWRKAVRDVWQQLRGLVVIRHDQNGEAAALVPEQRYFLYQNLKLQLESARLSLLRADAAGYRHSLDTAGDWLRRYFTGDERDAMMATLSALRERDIDIAIPDISASLNWLQEAER